jgi:hypothetical protein
MRLFFAIWLLVGCGVHDKPADKQPVTRLDELRLAYNSRVERLIGTGWLVQDCDGMLWSSQAGVAPELGFDPTLAEKEPGLFWRRPIDQPCWTPEQGDLGAKTTWSRDMFICGLLPWSVIRGRTDILDRHITYGEAHGWLMGEPMADMRALYSPSLIAMTYRAARRDIPAAHVPNIWPQGLTDYQAHLAACAALVEVEVDGSLSDGGQQLIAEQAAREPLSPLYLYLHGLYTGSQQPVIDLLLSTQHPTPDYVRNEGQSEAAWIFGAWLVMRQQARLHDLVYP